MINLNAQLVTSSGFPAVPIPTFINEGIFNCQIQTQIL